MKPWYDATVRYDRHPLHEIQAVVEGRTYETDDPEWLDFRRLESSSMLDGDLLRAGIEVAMCMRRVDEVLADPAVRSKLDETRGGAGGSLGPDRAQLVAALP